MAVPMSTVARHMWMRLNPDRDPNDYKGILALEACLGGDEAVAYAKACVSWPEVAGKAWARDPAPGASLDMASEWKTGAVAAEEI